jgi:hypothetical protein
VGSRRQGKRLGKSRSGDSGSDSGVDGSAGDWEGGNDRSSVSQTYRYAVVGGGIAHGCASRERERRTAGTCDPAGRACTDCGRFGQDRAGKGGRRRAGRSEHFGAAYCASTTLDPRVIPLGIRETAFVGRYRVASSKRGRAASGSGTFVRTQFRSARSSWRFCRDPAVGRTALRPHAASRYGPPTRWAAAGRRSTATRPQRHPAFFGIVAHSRRVRLPASQERRLHVIRRHSTDDTPGWPLDKPLTGTASTGW